MLEYFPREKRGGEVIKPTQNQLKALDRLSACEKKFVIFSAPTGTGKSLFGKAYGNSARQPSKNYIELVNTGKINKVDDISRRFIHEKEVYKEPAHGCFVLTPTILLQDQLHQDFNTEIFKGKSNYFCNLKSKKPVRFTNAPCLFSSKQKKACLKNKCCDYYNNQDAVLLSQFACLNYDKFIYLPDIFKRRQILVLDEAADIENIIIKCYEFTLDRSILQKHGINFKYREKTLIEDLIECYEDINKQIKRIRAYTKNNKPDKNTITKYQELSPLSIGLERLLKMYSNNKNSYVVTIELGNLIFTPLYIDIFCKELFRHAEKVVLMSATFINIKHYAKTLGLTEEDYDVVSISSDFDPNKSPIFIPDSGVYLKSEYFNDKTRDPLMIKALVREISFILSEHPNDKGIIHTCSGQITKVLREETLKKSSPLYKFKDRLIIRIKGEFSNSDLVKINKSSSDPVVLVSPSLTTGFDFKGDLGKFQIIAKCPWIGQNARAKLIMKQDKDWYNLLMLKNMVQACGRTTRSTEDSSDTYIIDKCFVKVLKKYMSVLDESFTKRLSLGNKLIREYKL
jgi:Rad3-related DNA helicase